MIRTGEGKPPEMASKGKLLTIFGEIGDETLDNKLALPLIWLGLVTLKRGMEVTYGDDLLRPR